MEAIKGQALSADIDSVGTISICGGSNDAAIGEEGYVKENEAHDIIQVAVVEADQQTRLALRVNLRAQVDIEVASEATNGETGLVILESIDVDVAVVDAALPDMNLVKFLRSARRVQENSYVIPSKILILVTPEQSTILCEAIAAGVDGFCLKDSPIEKLAEAVRIIHKKGRYEDPAIAPLLEKVAPVGA
jgi:anaerobic magnesium-protoporphyrin IX monomethyl ester cyclase